MSVFLSKPLLCVQLSLMLTTLCTNKLAGTHNAHMFINYKLLLCHRLSVIRTKLEFYVVLSTTHYNRGNISTAIVHLRSPGFQIVFKEYF